MAKGRLQRLIREVKVVEAGGLQLLNSKNWGQVMDEVDISSSKWSVMDTEQHIKSLSSPIQRPPTLNLRLNTRLRSGNLVLRTTELTIGYVDTPLFVADPIELHRGECAALIGPNGTGKSTFLRTLMQEISPLTGQLQFGASLKVGYLAQSQDKFNPENSVLDELLDHKHMLLGEARSYLAQYLFRGEDVYKSVSMLSGGERARLALAILALEGANLLLLDEPTNHLDIPAQEILQEVLEHFDGTILLVSHDRYLIDRLATQIWELQDGRLHITPFGYQEYLVARDQARAETDKASAEQRAAKSIDQRGDRVQRNEERRRMQQISTLEDEIHRLEQQLANIEAALVKASHDEDLDALQRLSAQYEQTQSELNEQMETWSELAAA